MPSPHLAGLDVLVPPELAVMEGKTCTADRTLMWWERDRESLPADVESTMHRTNPCAPDPFYTSP